MQVRSDAKGLDLRLEFSGSIPQTIQTDPTRVRQVLVNIVGNAIKFTEQGEVSILVSRLGHRQLLFEVRDTGLGMTEEQLGRLFDPFTQADSSTSREFGGTGLGLAISRRLSKLLGGDISVTSAVGRGSSFRVSIDCGCLDGIEMIPAQEIDLSVDFTLAANETIESASAQPLAEMHLLYAEDGPDNQRLVSHILRRAGATVTIAQNGQEAVDLATHEDFDLVLMDMQMPVLDGYGAVRELRSAGYSVPIVALTANAMSTDREKCLAAGCDEFATKPIDKARLLRTLAGLLNQEPDSSLLSQD